MNDQLPPEIIAALRKLATLFTTAADAGTKTAFDAIAEDKEGLAALDLCQNYSGQ